MLASKIDLLQQAGAKRASELGKPLTKHRDPWYYPHLCHICGKETWHQKKDLYRACSDCTYLARTTPSGESHPNWKGGRYPHKDGYMIVQLAPDSPYYSMATDRGIVLEHRLVVAQALGRPLTAGEIVHHKHDRYQAGSIEDKQDNRYPENLELLQCQIEHLPSMNVERTVSSLSKKITEQEAEIVALKLQILKIEQSHQEINKLGVK
jgi:ribosomal protein L37E